MKRCAVITRVEIYAGEDVIGSVKNYNGIGYKAKLEPTFMSGDDIAFVGKVLEFVEENGDVEIEEEIE